MNRKLTCIRTALLLSLSMSFTAAAAGRWYYDGAVGKWKLVTVAGSPENGSGKPTSASEAALDPLSCLRRQWFQDPEDHYWYYLDHDGWMLTGLQELDGIRYRFRDRPHQGNYVPDTDDNAIRDDRGTGFYSYRANGCPTYGSLIEILGDTNQESGGRSRQVISGMREIGQDTEKDAVEQEAVSAPEASQEMKKPEATASDLPANRPEKSSASDLPRTDQKASASDIGPTGPNEENERRQELEEDEQIHSHIDRDEESHCIAYDRWSRILQHPLDYEDCFDNRCTSRLYLTGTDISLPGEAGESEADTVRIPLYVSLLRSPRDSAGQLELVQAYAADALLLPMQVGVENAESADPRGNAGGAGESLPWAILNGGTYHWTDMDGTEHNESYEGFRLYSQEAEGYRQLTPKEAEQLGTQGFLAETRLADDGWQYLNWRSNDFTGSGDGISFLTQTKGRFHFLSEQNLFGTAAASLPLPLQKNRFYPAAEDSWRSDAAYWLSSTPCSGFWVADHPDLLEDLYPEMSGPVTQLDYTEAGRHYLLYEAGAALDETFFADAARADRGISAAEASDRQMLRLRFSLGVRG